MLANYWRLVEKYRPTSLSAVPTVLAALANVPLDGADISSINYCRTGAAVLAPELAARFERLFGLHVHESLGMTEMAGISTITPPGVIGPAGCVGFPPAPFAAAHRRARRARQRERPRAAGGRAGHGAVQVAEPVLGLRRSGRQRPRPSRPTAGSPPATSAGSTPRSRLNLSGRSKDLIIRSGHNIDPKTIEDALGAHPAVQLCAAVGAPDAYAGELPVVFATLVPGHAASEAELLAFTAARVDEAPAKPKSVIVIEHMPMTNVGKIYKPELRALAARKVAEALVDEACAALGLVGAARRCRPMARVR